MPRLIVKPVRHGLWKVVTDPTGRNTKSMTMWIQAKTEQDAIRKVSKFYKQR